MGTLTRDFFDWNLRKAIQESWNKNIRVWPMSCVFEFPTSVNMTRTRLQTGVNWPSSNKVNDNMLDGSDKSRSDAIIRCPKTKSPIFSCTPSIDTTIKIYSCGISETTSDLLVVSCGWEREGLTCLQGICASAWILFGVCWGSTLPWPNRPKPPRPQE